METENILSRSTQHRQSPTTSTTHMEIGEPSRNPISQASTLQKVTRVDKCMGPGKGKTLPFAVNLEHELNGRKNRPVVILSKSATKTPATTAQKKPQNIKFSPQKVQQKPKLEDAQGNIHTIKTTNSDYEELQEIPFTGNTFTWCNNRKGDKRIVERLDQAFATPGWLAKFPWANVVNMPILTSDHDPMILKTTQD
ncbi:OLC1v1024894C1 [Oldenlandia corymbosa var. corymbosa]|uniref:OLC1v1024894C1 n=1 Tax=Oldenlandia corymbosa var. corymbosa TaxID=529605 RepID=A0AAV1C559_OLDCO|nr:OLC1v1024894C1 [Oldenlandia corymbosa var. corymbosa]